MNPSLTAIMSVSFPLLGDLEAELVLNLGQGSLQERTVPNYEEEEQSSLWTVQRVRLSPQEKHLAATLKANETEETR